MRAKKENKVYQISADTEKERYLKQGFDIYNDEGELIEHSPLKKIEYGKYAVLKKELEAVKAELEVVKSEKADDEAVMKILTAYATEHEVDIGRATTVTGIVKKIQEAAGDQ